MNNCTPKKTNTQDSPFDHAVGINLTKLSKGFCEGELELEPFHYNQMQTVHGGCLFTFIDCVAGTAAQTSGTVTTANADMHFFRPARGMEKLICVAKIIKGGRSLQIVEAYIFDNEDTEHEKPIAKATITYFILSPEIPADVLPYVEGTAE